MASNPVAANPASTDRMSAGRVSEIVGTVTSVINEIERLLAASGVGGALNLAQIEQLTTLFGNLAGVAIQAAHDVLGKPVTPGSVLALLPKATALVEPPAGASSAA
jgi:hypothetical protein